MKDTAVEASRVSPATRRPAAIFVRLDRLDAALKTALGPNATVKAKATFLGVDGVTFWRLRNGHKVSTETIAAIRLAPWPAQRRPTLEDLFWAQDPDARADTAQ